MKKITSVESHMGWCYVQAAGNEEWLENAGQSALSRDSRTRPATYLMGFRIIRAIMDRVSKAARSRIMSAIRSRDTKIEILLRRELHRRGLRYRIHYAKVPGKPDVAFVRQKVAVFCDSEFWHGRDWSTLKVKIGTNREYWVPKIERNMRRDREVTRMLRDQGWVVIRLWGDDILTDVGGCADSVERALKKTRPST